MTESARITSPPGRRASGPGSARRLAPLRAGDADGEHGRGNPADREPRRGGCPPPEPLWRQVLGQRLRAIRLRRGETLSATADRAGISPQYLSEIERGRKEPSSELIAAVAGALDTTLLSLTELVAGDLRRQQATYPAAAPRAVAPGAPVLALAA